MVTRRSVPSTTSRVVVCMVAREPCGWTDCPCSDQCAFTDAVNTFCRGRWGHECDDQHIPQPLAPQEVKGPAPPDEISSPTSAMQTISILLSALVATSSATSLLSLRGGVRATLLHAAWRHARRFFSADDASSRHTPSSM